MKSIIEEIYYGSLKTELKHSKEYWDTMKVLSEKIAALSELMKDNEEMKKIFKEFENADGEILCMEVYGYYKLGFRHGFRLALDALDEE